jgi:hypothetical protein
MPEEERINKMTDLQETKILRFFSFGKCAQISLSIFNHFNSFQFIIHRYPDSLHPSHEPQKIRLLAGLFTTHDI